MINYNLLFLLNISKYEILEYIQYIYLFILTHFKFTLQATELQSDLSSKFSMKSIDTYTVAKSND